MSELNYEIKEYKEWLNKPNFIIDIDRSDFTLFQRDLLILLKIFLKMPIKRQFFYLKRALECSCYKLLYLLLGL